MVFQLCAVFVSAAIGLLIWQLIRTLRTTNETLSGIQSAVGQMQQELDRISEQSLLTLKSAQELTDELNKDIKSLSGLFAVADSMASQGKQVSQSIEAVSSSIIQTLKDAEQSTKKHQQHINDVLDWTSAGIQIWKSWQAHRKEAQNQRAAKTDKGDESNG